MRPTLIRAFAGGLIGTVVITLVMYFVSPFVIGGPMDVAAMLASFLGASWVVGLITHFVIGVFALPALYVMIYPGLGGAPTTRGITWGVILWLLAQAVVLPVTGGGFFSALAGGWRAVIDSLCGHLLYGLVLGAIAGGSRDFVEDRLELEPQVREPHVRVRRAG